MNPDSIKMSKFLSYVLRHSEESIGLVMDDSGWVFVDELLRGAKESGRKLTLSSLHEIVRKNDKQRFELSSDKSKIRARQGHSVPVDLKLESMEPPSQLFHGTAWERLPSIMSAGLQRGSRHHVHLQTDPVKSELVGSRHGKPVVLQIESGIMHQEGFKFFLTANGVWLVDHVPIHFIEVLRKEKDRFERIPEVKSCGILCFRRQPHMSFLLMRHPQRFDLPKGHLKSGESEMDCSLREFTEETGIPRECLEVDPDFKFQTTYFPMYQRLGGQRVKKTVVIFQAWLLEDVEVLNSEHVDYSWVRWDPPHAIQTKTVDPLLQAMDAYWSCREK